MYQNRTGTSIDKKHQPVHTPQRQKRQVSPVTSDKGQKLPLRKVKHLQTMILDVKDRRKVGYRWFERFGKHRFGWYQHIAAGNFNQVHVTELDYFRIKQVYDLMREDAKIDAELLTLLLDYIEQRSKCDETMGKIVAVARRNTK